MLHYPGLFALLARIAGAFGYGGLVGDLAEFFKTLFFVLVSLAALGCVLNRTRESVDSIDRDGDRVGNRAPGEVRTHRD